MRARRRDNRSSLNTLGSLADTRLAYPRFKLCTGRTRETNVLMELFEFDKEKLMHKNEQIGTSCARDATNSNAPSPLPPHKENGRVVLQLQQNIGQRTIRML